MSENGNNDDSFKEEIKSVFEKVAEILGLKDYIIQIKFDSERGNGFLGEFFMGDVIDNETNKKIGVAVKKAIPNMRIGQFLDIPVAYKNENWFYSKIFPALDKFQKSRGVKVPFEAVPKYYFGSNEFHKEKVVMENLLQSGYELHEKSQPLSEDLIKLIFEQYGRFHALSFAFKHDHPEEFEALVSELGDVTSNMLKKGKWRDFLIGCISEAATALETANDYKIIEKLEKLTVPEGFQDTFQEIITYNGPYSCCLHGDCWSNNMLFKFDSDTQKLQSMKMLDFQLTRAGTPVYDLSYFFYSGVAKKDLDKLDEYLDIYYDSFTSFSKELGFEPEILYPKDHLKVDWKKFAKFGLLMALPIFKIKAVKKEDIAIVASRTTDSREKIVNITASPEDVTIVALNLVKHCYEYGVL